MSGATHSTDDDPPRDATADPLSGIHNPVVRRLLHEARERGEDATQTMLEETLVDLSESLETQTCFAPDNGSSSDIAFADGDGPPTMASPGFGYDDATLVDPLSEEGDADGSGSGARGSQFYPDLQIETATFLAEETPSAVASEPSSGSSSAMPQEPSPAPASTRPRPGKHAGILRGFALDLVDQGILSERRAVSLALQARESGQSLLRTIARDTAVAEVRSVFVALGRHLGVPTLDDKNELFERLQSVSWLTPQLAEKYLLLPLEPRDGVSQFAAIDPFDVALRDLVQRQQQSSAALVPIQPDLFWDGLNRYRAQDLDQPSRASLIVPIEIDWTERIGERPDVSDWDIPVVVDYVLHQSIEANASDVHVEPSEEELVVRYRIDGLLHELLRLPVGMHAPISSRIKVLSNLDVAEKRRPQDGRISVLIRDRAIDIRVSTLPTVNGEKVVMRLLDDSALRPRPEQLGLSERDLKLLIDKINAPYGMIMLSGPTGSGKTTTLYSCLSAIDRMTRNVVTIEDPVEYRLRGVHQMQVNEKIGLTFASGLRNVLRQDPDVIMVGECRDSETAKLAVQSALTGHLVLSTIHANDAVGVANRLLDLQVDPFLIASSLSISIAQRLLRIHCAHCLDVIDGRDMITQLRSEGVSLERLDSLGLHIDPDLPCPVATGCQRCRYTGYDGRQAVFELFTMTDEAKALLMKAPFDATAFKRLVREQGMRSMIENAQGLIDEGRTSYSELVRVLGEH